MELRKNFMKRALSPAEAAFMFSLSPGTLANWRSQKRGPRFYRLGGHKIVYFLDDLEQWARQEPVLTADSVESEG